MAPVPIPNPPADDAPHLLVIDDDRRQRLLYVTPKGEQLAMKLAGLQTERIARALGEIGPNAHEAARRFLVAMIDADGRDDVQKLITRADRARRPRS